MCIFQYCNLFSQNNTKSLIVSTPVAETPKKNTNIIEKQKDTIVSVVSNGYFSWVFTGDADKDAENIQQASEKFKKDHPNEYQKIATDTNKVKIRLSDFQIMSKEQQKNISSHPDFFQILKNSEK